MVMLIRYIASVIVWVIVALAAIGSIGELKLLSYVNIVILT